MVTRTGHEETYYHNSRRRLHFPWVFHAERRESNQKGVPPVEALGSLQIYNMDPPVPRHSCSISVNTDFLNLDFDLAILQHTKATEARTKTDQVNVSSMNRGRHA